MVVVSHFRKSNLVNDNEIRIFEIIKSSILEMEEINNQDKEFLPQILSDLKVISRGIENPKNGTTDNELSRMINNIIKMKAGTNEILWFRNKLLIEINRKFS
ncbi:MAG TPA: hypothetical protein PK559_13585 [Ignavibacteriaceae bacterium]|nr:hypothetical protein [Ignavibacteriaceae bacterium]